MKYRTTPKAKYRPKDVARIPRRGLRSAIYGTPEEKQREIERVKAINVAASVLDRMRFLSHYLSGKTNITLRADALASPRTYLHDGYDPPRYTITLPAWLSYKPPGLSEFDRYRTYRFSNYHEALHVKYSPPELFAPGSFLKRLGRSDYYIHPYLSFLINSLEDRRIEDLGDVEFPGYRPERIFSNAYFLSLRQDVSKITDPNVMRLEAFLQKLVAGHVNGWDKLPPEQKKLIGEAVELAEKKLRQLTKPGLKGEDVALKVIELAEDVAKKLNLVFPDKIQSMPQDFQETFGRDSFDKARAKEGDEEIKKKVKEWLEKFEEAAEEDGGKGEEEGKREPGKFTKSEVEAAKKGSAEAKTEYERTVEGVRDVPEIEEAGFARVPAETSPAPYLDRAFVEKTVSALKHLKKGKLRVPSETAGVLSIPTYISSRGKLPFKKTVRLTPKGRSVLFVVDFSGSMARKEDEYKKALISGLEALNRLSIKTGLFAFAETEGTQTYYVVKALEEPKWTQRHAAKLAALEAGGQTPTPIMYEKLKKYIRKTRPHITVTVTDGKPNRYFPGEDPEEATRRLVKELKRDTRMVAFGIEEDSRALANQLKSFGYHQITAVPDLRKLPNEFVKLIAPEIKVAT